MIKKGKQFGKNEKKVWKHW